MFLSLSSYRQASRSDGRPHAGVRLRQAVVLLRSSTSFTCGVHTPPVPEDLVISSCAVGCDDFPGAGRVSAVVTHAPQYTAAWVLLLYQWLLRRSDEPACKSYTHAGAGELPGLGGGGGGHGGAQPTQPVPSAPRVDGIHHASALDVQPTAAVPRAPVVKLQRQQR